MTEVFRPTPEEVHKITGKSLANIRKHLPVIYEYCDKYYFTAINPTIAVLATVACENNFAPVREIGNQAYFRRMYGNRTDYVEDADGLWRWRGAGFVQLTGEDNYRRMQEETGLPLLADPDILVKDPRASAHVLLQFMRNIGADVHAQWGDWWHIRRQVNGPGMNNWDYFAGKKGIVWKFIQLARVKR